MDVLEYLAAGMTPAEIVDDFPTLKPEHVSAALEFAAVRERRLAAPRVKFLVDENLSPKIVRLFDPRFPGTMHVSSAGLAGSGDEAIWRYAGEHGFVVLSKDSDFNQRALLRGHPPKIVWARVGEMRTNEIAATVLARADELDRFEDDAELSVFVI